MEYSNVFNEGSVYRFINNKGRLNMKKIFAGITALTLMLSGVLCGCSENKKSGDIIEESNEYSQNNISGSAGFTYATTKGSGSSKSYFELGKYEGGVVITGYVGNETDIVIPEQIDGKPVIGINDFAF